MSTHPLTPSVLFCSQCGTQTEHIIPADDSRLRAVCPACGMIHYDNPKIVVGTIPVINQQVLLCQRAIEPGSGMWTLPAGFMENGETMAQGAARETLEEACAAVELIEPVYCLVDIPHIGQIHVFFRAHLTGTFQAGHETLAVRLFDFADIPWDEIAFNSVKTALKSYIADTAHGEFATRHHTRHPRHPNMD
jgi:ADP-ribose pyrophosphatase YjhB (NUDIX family)